MASPSEPTKEQLEAAAAALEQHGINISLPWEGDLDDLEKERFDGLKAAVKAVLSDMTKDHNTK
jgi:hypothetical protein